MRKTRVVLAVLAAMAVLLAILCQCFYFQETNRIENVYFEVSVDSGTSQRIALHHVEGIYYAFLPAYTDLASTSVAADAGYTLYIDGENYTHAPSCHALSFDLTYSVEIKNSMGIGVSKANLILKKASNIPTLSIHLSDGSLESLHSSQSVSASGTALLITGDREIAYSGAFAELHGRGNSTWSQPKKSYTLGFEAETDLLGMGSSTDWVLLANSMDESSLRNKLVYDTAQALDLPFACESAYVNLYVDSTYQGLYLLAERVDVGINRVDIANLQEQTQSVNQMVLSNYQQVEKVIDGKIQRGYDIPNNPEDISGGYLLQIEHHADRIASKNSLIQTETLNFSLSYPKYASKEQVSYISDYMNAIESQIIAGDLSGIGVDSFATLYLLQEFFANADRCSVFVYKNSDRIDSKLYAGPVWDFDLSIGNGWLTSDVSPDIMLRNNGNWFNYLLNCSVFTERVHQLYWERLRPNLLVLMDQKLQEYASLIGASFDMDKLRWDGAVCANNWGDSCQKRFDTLDEHIDRIRIFLTGRVEFLDSAWAENSEYCSLSFCSPDIGNYCQNYYVKNGESLSFHPNPASAGTASYQFIGWFDEAGNEYDPNTAVTHSAVYFAKWEQATAEAPTSPETPQSDASAPRLSKTAMLIGVCAIAILFFILSDIVREIKYKRCSNDK